jgi:hypothetical protein
MSSQGISAIAFGSAPYFNLNTKQLFPLSEDLTTHAIAFFIYRNAPKNALSINLLVLAPITTNEFPL